MTHNQFISSFHNGAFGCGVRTPRALWLFFSGVVDRSKVQRVLGLLAVVSLAFFGSCFLLFAFAPPILAIIGSIFSLAISCLVINLRMGEFVIEYALAAGSFFGLAVDRQVLAVWDEEEEHCFIIPDEVLAESAVRLTPALTQMAL